MFDALGTIDFSWLHLDSEVSSLKWLRGQKISGLADAALASICHGTNPALRDSIRRLTLGSQLPEGLLGRVGGSSASCREVTQKMTGVGLKMGCCAASHHWLRNMKQQHHHYHHQHYLTTRGRAAVRSPTT